MNTPNLYRIRHLLIHHTEQEKQAWLITAGIIAAITFIPAAIMLILIGINIPGIVNEVTDGNALNSWTGIYFLVGTIFASRIFRSLHNPGSAWQTLMIPASTLEKWLAAWIISVPVYTLVFTLLALVIGTLQNLLSLLIIGESFPLSTPFGQGFWFTTLLYIFVTGIYLWGSIRFKSLHFIKTSILLAAGYLSLVVIAGLVLFVVYQVSGPEQVVETGQKISGFFMTIGLEESVRLLRIWVSMLFAALSGLVLWRSYVRLTKAEVA